jgi:hypothetical protein
MKNLKYIVFYLLIVILSLPLIQFETHIFKIKELGGWYTKYSSPHFDAEKWFSGDFQGSYNEYFENNFGFRPWFVKMRNQIKFSFYHELSGGIEIGQNNYLYELNYIRAYNGLDYMGDSTILSISDSIKEISDILAKRNIDLIVCFAAGKGSFYPEHFPMQYLNKKSDKTNYLEFKKILTEKNLHIIDFNEWFVKMKDTSRYILYPKYGIHWSEYGAFIAGDSLLRYVEKLRNIDLPDLIVEKIETTNRLRSSDYDIAKSLNLIFQLPSDKMAYPKFKWNTVNKDTCKVIVLSDSFYWQLFNMGWGTIGFASGGFWYYNNIAYPANMKISEIDYLKNIYQSQVVILFATEATLNKFPFGFIHDFFINYKSSSQ